MISEIAFKISLIVIMIRGGELLSARIKLRNARLVTLHEIQCEIWREIPAVHQITHCKRRFRT